MEDLMSDVHNNPDIKDLYTDLIDIWIARQSFRDSKARELLEEISSLTGVTKADVMNLVRRDPSGTKQYIRDHQRPEIVNSRQATLRDIESRLDQLGYKYSVHAGMGNLGTNYFIYKNQKDHRKEQQELRSLAERTGGSFDNSAKSSYRISTTSLEREQ